MVEPTIVNAEGAEVPAPPPTEPSNNVGLVALFFAMLARQVRMPNRLAIWLTASADISGFIVQEAADLGVASTTTLGLGLAGLNALCLMFLRGWQQYENAGQTDELEARAITRQLEAMQDAGRGKNALPKSRLAVPKR